MKLEFDWDPAKAASNRARHGVSFDDAMAVFVDPLALSLIDVSYGAREGRWITLGSAPNGRRYLVVHTYIELNERSVAIRIISAREPTRREIRQYEEGFSA